MFTILLAFFILAIYLACPLIGKLVLLMVNAVIPDPIPYIDEIIMVLSLGMHIERLEAILEFVSEHKVLSILILILLIWLLVWFVPLLWNWVFG